MGRLKIQKVPLEGLLIIEPQIYEDVSGYFMETYNRRDIEDMGLDIDFVQDNQSVSIKGVLRGLHFQKKYPQGKLMRVISGKIFDVAVDVRPNSNTFGQWYGVELSAENHKQFYIPAGFAHGFYVLSDDATISYKVTEYWHPNDEIGIPWDDPSIAVNWPIPSGEFPIIAEKDKNYELFKNRKW